MIFKAMIGLAAVSVLSGCLHVDPGKLASQAEKFKAGTEATAKALTARMETATFTTRMIHGDQYLSKKPNDLNAAFAEYACSGIGLFAEQQAALTILNAHHANVTDIAAAPEEKITKLWANIRKLRQERHFLRNASFDSALRYKCEAEVKDILENNPADDKAPTVDSFMASIAAATAAYEAIKLVLTKALTIAEGQQRKATLKKYVLETNAEVKALLGKFTQPGSQYKPICNVRLVEHLKKIITTGSGLSFDKMGVCIPFFKSVSERAQEMRAVCTKDAKSKQQLDVCNAFYGFSYEVASRNPITPKQIISSTSLLTEFEKTCTDASANKDWTSLQKHMCKTFLDVRADEDSNTHKHQMALELICSTGDAGFSNCATVNTYVENRDKDKVILDKCLTTETCQPVYALKPVTVFDDQFIIEKWARLRSAYFAFAVYAEASLPIGAEAKAKRFQAYGKIHNALSGYDAIRTQQRVSNLIAGMQRSQDEMLKLVNKDYELSDLWTILQDLFDQGNELWEATKDAKSKVGDFKDAL